MRGIDFVKNKRGKKTAVLIDLKRHGQLWEDFYDSGVMSAREPARISDSMKVKCSFQTCFVVFQRVARLVSNVRVRSSPAQPCAIPFHPPDPPIASQSITRDVRFAQASTAYVNGPFQASFLCLFGRIRMSLPLRPWREHLPQFSNLIGPVCALREHGSDVRILPPPFWCAPWASKGDE